MGKNLAWHWQQWDWSVTATDGSWAFPLVKWYDHGLFSVCRNLSWLPYKHEQLMQSHTNRYLCCFQELWCDIVWTCGSAVSKFPNRLLDLLKSWCIFAYIVCRDSVYGRDVKFWALSSRCIIQDLLVVLTAKLYLKVSKMCVLYVQMSNKLTEINAKHRASQV